MLVYMANLILDEYILNEFDTLSAKDQDIELWAWRVHDNFALQGRTH